MKPTYALFRGSQQISKVHTNKWTVMMEAFEKGLVLQYHKNISLIKGYTVKEIRWEDNTSKDVSIGKPIIKHRDKVPFNDDF
jgi:hypothetical protein|tara:strand:+ start:3723 stop:3968 length:246 start_codon:yes stop_codon:yes gene_type:complete